jgi:hypothetical protein
MVALQLDSLSVGTMAALLLDSLDPGCAEHRELSWVKDFFSRLFIPFCSLRLMWSDYGCDLLTQPIASASLLPESCCATDFAQPPRS